MPSRSPKALRSNRRQPMLAAACMTSSMVAGSTKLSGSISLFSQLRKKPAGITWPAYGRMSEDHVTPSSIIRDMNEKSSNWNHEP